MTWPDKNMQIGNYNKLPHYAVIGEPCCFYLWVNEDGNGNATRWIKGTNAINEYHKLVKLYKNKKKWQRYVKQLWLRYGKRNF